MKSNHLCKITLFISLFCSVVFAQNKVGNGGDVVSCINSNVILDFYESDQKTILISSNSKKYTEILKDQFEKFKNVAPKVFNNYLDRLKSIESEIEYKKNIKLTDIKDSEELFLPEDKSCHLYQIAIRKKSKTESEKRFIIDKKLWNKLDEVNKAGLISHEIIYEHLSKLNETNSVNVRKINRFVFSQNSKDNDFWKLIQELKIELYP
jgi:hypothetical protein